VQIGLLVFKTEYSVATNDRALHTLGKRHQRKKPMNDLVTVLELYCIREFPTEQELPVKIKEAAGF
jgi:hypothetical protein